MLELIAKRLNYLGSKRYFPSSEFKHRARIKADKKINAAALIVDSAEESIDNSSKSAIYAAVACKSPVAESMKLTAMQRETAIMSTANYSYTRK